MALCQSRLAHHHVPSICLKPTWHSVISPWLPRIDATRQSFPFPFLFPTIDVQFHLVFVFSTSRTMPRRRSRGLNVPGKLCVRSEIVSTGSKSLTPLTSRSRRMCPWGTLRSPSTRPPIGKGRYPPSPVFLKNPDTSSLALHLQGPLWVR